MVNLIAAKYEHLRILGRGCFGTAVLVRDRSNNDVQPLRVLKDIDLSWMSAAARKEAHKEVDVLKSLKHTNIIAFCSTFVEVGHLYIVMEYANSGSVAESIAQRRMDAEPFIEGEALAIFVQCCFALKHMHDKHILHRDLKSHNIFLTEDGTVKLGDFGISKRLDSTQERANTVIGTPSYLAPEVCDNMPYDTKADIWSLGVVFYEMLALDLPFKARSLAALVVKIVTKKPPPLSESSYSKDTRQLIKRLLRKDPKKRLGINRILTLPTIVRTATLLVSKDLLSESEISTRAPSRNNSIDSTLARGIAAKSDKTSPRHTQVPLCPSQAAPRSRLHRTRCASRGSRPSYSRESSTDSQSLAIECLREASSQLEQRVRTVENSPAAYPCKRESSADIPRRVLVGEANLTLIPQAVQHLGHCSRTAVAENTTALDRVQGASCRLGSEKQDEPCFRSLPPLPKLECQQKSAAQIPEKPRKMVQRTRAKRDQSGSSDQILHVAHRRHSLPVMESSANKLTSRPNSRPASQPSLPPVTQPRILGPRSRTPAEKSISRWY
jgi:serine/threonine protein kinase